MRLILSLLLACIGASALAFGMVMISNPEGTVLGLHVSLLGPSPFKNYIAPGLILALVVGGVNIAALFFNFTNQKSRYNWAIAGGIIICSWIVGQVIIIEAVNWLHFLYLGTGLFVILLGWQLKGKWLA